MAKKIKLKPGQVLAKAALTPKSGSGDGRMHAYTIARIVEGAQDDPSFDAQTRRKLRDKWTISKIEAMSTDVLVDRLRTLGIELDIAQLRQLAEQHRSAWDASRASREAQPRLDGDEDFIGLAFCALWKRWLPDTPSIEMIDDWIIEGYRCAESHQHDEGLGIWRRAWDTLRVRLHSTMTTTGAAERSVFPGLTSLYNWTQDYVQEHVHVSPGYVDAGAQLVDELLAQFADERLVYRQNVAADKSEIYEIAGRIDDAERAAQNVIDLWPNHAMGYAVLAGLKAKSDHRDEAIAIIERALAVPVVDAREFELKLRLRDLQGAPNK